jgi:magnesium chelatase subunit D
VKREDPARLMRTADATLACALLALDPIGFGGAVLRGPGGPARDGWVTAFSTLIRDRKMFRVPPHVGTDRLVGGIDVAATLKTGTPRHDKGLLAEADGGVLLLTSSERLTLDKAALLAAAMDKGEVNGAGGTHPARFALIACDEGIEDERTPAILSERVAFLLDTGDCDPPALDDLDLGPASARLAGVAMAERFTEGLCQTALALGIASVRPAILALRAARACAALDGRAEVDDDDATAAARLVLAPRATQFPASEAEEPPEPESQEPEPQSSPESEAEKDTPSPQELSEILLEAVKMSLPAGLLAALEKDLRQKQAPKSGAGAVSAQTGLKRGRPAGTRQGEPKNGARLSLIDTLRAAAPWQPLRKRDAPGRTGVMVAREDFRISRYKQKRETTAIFVVDASGSAALHRMAEAKGAVELILADCYVRRDQTALIAFRGRKAEVLLPPTRSLQRAKRSLADLPGGGGTPLCAAIESAFTVADQIRRGGGTPLIVFLTDGRANIARDGTADRAMALRDAETAARGLKLSGFRTLMIDLSDARGGPARKIADEMGASYLPLPHADSTMISKSVGTAMKVRG